MIHLNDKELKVTLFPDNTSQVWQIPENLIKDDFNKITWTYYTEGEFLQIAQLKDLLNSYSVGCSLEIKYLPYGRQDKEVSNTSTFALRTFAKLLNSLCFEEIIIHDPHSIVALQLIRNSKAIYPKDTVLHLFDKYEHALVCYPDKGALSKYGEMYGCSYVYGEKVRDQLSGNILSYKLMGQSVKGYKVLIVDDICDGGMTFKLLAKELLNAGATEVNLFVTHGIFSKGLRTLKESGINKVFTLDGEVSEHQQQLNYRRI